MADIQIKELIITCEACGNVKKFTVKNQKDSESIFEEYSCENNCGRNLYSFITVGLLNRNSDSSS